jgi:hypothetical protein
MRIYLAYAKRDVPYLFSQAVAETKKVLGSSDHGHQVIWERVFVPDAEFLLAILDHAENDSEVAGALYLARQRINPPHILAVASGLAKILPSELGIDPADVRSFLNLSCDAPGLILSAINNKKQLAAA